MRGRKPKPSAIRRIDGNPGKRGYNALEPVPPDGLPSPPRHLSGEALDEWDRLAVPLHQMGVLTIADRAAFAAYCQAYGRWAEAEERLRTTPVLIRMPSGYVQQSPWLSIANKQSELMGRYMVELGLTPAARSRVIVDAPPMDDPVEIRLVGVRADAREEFPTRIEDQGQRESADAGGAR